MALSQLGRGTILVGLTTLSMCAPGCVDREVGQYRFHRAVVNLEYAAVGMKPVEHAVLHDRVGQDGELWSGTIMRRLSGDSRTDSRHYLPFLARYTQGLAQQAWWDSDLDGSLEDEHPVNLTAYRSPAGARSFLAEFHWRTGPTGDEHDIHQMVRVVLEPRIAIDTNPVYRVQTVYGMVGRVYLDGRRCRAVLFDGNGDGLYTHDPLDGMFVDLDGDRHLSIDPFSPEFGSFSSQFSMGHYVYEATDIDPEGRALTLRRLDLAHAVRPPIVGELAPDAPFEDETGRRTFLDDYRGRPVVIYFFAMWCGQATSKIGALKSLYAQYRSSGLEILMVSFDADRAALDTFLAEHAITWPTSFSGKVLWNDPLGRAYKVRYPGIFFLIDTKGRLHGQYEDTPKLADAVADVIEHRPDDAVRTLTRASPPDGVD